MEPLILQAAGEDAGKRLDAWLAEQTELTRSAAQKLLEEGRVTAGGKPLAKNTRLTGAETVSVLLPEPETVDIVPQNIPLDVVYEDGDVIVVNKPKGLVVHPAPGHPDGTLVNALLYHCGDSLSGINGELRPGIVHRIDRDTSGLIIAAKNDAAHVKLAAQLQDHTLARTYRCIVVGNLREDAGTVDAPIGRCPADRKKMAVIAGGRRPTDTRSFAVSVILSYILRLSSSRSESIQSRRLMPSVIVLTSRFSCSIISLVSETSYILIILFILSILCRLMNSSLIICAFFQKYLLSDNGC